MNWPALILGLAAAATYVAAGVALGRLRARVTDLECDLRDLRRDHGDALRNQAAMIRDHVEATTGRPWR